MKQFETAFGVLLHPPLYTDGPQYKNWAATLTFFPTANEKFARKFWARAGSGQYKVPSDLGPGAIIEFGSDMVGENNSRVRRRAYYKVAGIGLCTLDLEQQSSSLKALADAGASYKPLRHVLLRFLGAIKNAATRDPLTPPTACDLCDRPQDATCFFIRKATGSAALICGSCMALAMNSMEELLTESFLTGEF